MTVTSGERDVIAAWLPRLVQLDEVAGRIVQEGLPARADR
jgi:hypothetical protein